MFEAGCVTNEALCDTFFTGVTNRMKQSASLASLELNDIANSSYSLLLILAFSSLTVYGLIIAG